MYLALSLVVLLVQCEMEVYAVLTTASPTTGFYQKTTCGLSYFETGINLTDVDHFVFQVKATKAFKVAIVETPGVYNQSMFQFLFAESSDTYAYIRNQTLGIINLASGLKVGLLQNGTRYITLWLSWRNGILVAGTGEVVGLRTTVTYRPIPPMTKINTVDINSCGSIANWIIAYDQVTNVSVLDETSFYANEQPFGYNSGTCGARTFSGSVPLPVILLGKDSVVLQLNFTSILAEVRFFATNGYYYNFQLRSTYFNISSNLAAVILGSGLNNDGILSRTYWFSWKSGVASMGIGAVVGRDTVVSYDYGSPISVTSMTTTGLTEILVPIEYLSGASALNGSRNGRYNAATQLIQHIDVCLSVCVLLTVPNRHCLPSYCALSCLNRPICTSFCFRQPKGDGVCTCDLYAWSGPPPPPSLYAAETGDIYWKVV